MSGTQALFLVALAAISLGSALLTIMVFTRRDGPLWWLIRAGTLATLLRLTGQWGIVVSHFGDLAHLDWYEAVYLLGSGLGAIVMWALALGMLREKRSDSEVSNGQ